MLKPRDNSQKIEQLNRAKSGYEASIANMEAASESDGVDRSGAISSEKRCIAAIEKQIADLTPKPEEKPDPIPSPVTESPAPESSPT